MNLKKIIGINLKYLRYKSNLSQEEFYSKYNLSAKYLACVERGEVNVTVDFIEKLAKCLNISYLDLITFNENRIINDKRVDSKKLKVKI